SGRLTEKAPDPDSLKNKLEEGLEAEHGTTAKIDGATVVAGGDIAVEAAERMDVEYLAGSAAAGVVGLGAGISVINLSGNVRASAGGTLTAGGSVRVESEFDQTVDVTSVSMQAGFVGLGAAVVVVNDNSVQVAEIAAGTTVNGAAAVTLMAETDQQLEGSTLGAQVGAVGAGASVVIVNANGGTTAEIGDGAAIGADAAVGSIAVAADSNISASADVFALAGGIGAFSGNVAQATVAPDVAARIGEGTVNATGAVDVAATAMVSAKAETFGVNAGGLAVGVSLAKARGDAEVDASVAGDITAGSLAVTATLTFPEGGHSAEATATGATGALIGVTAALAGAESTRRGEGFPANGSTP